MITCLICNKQFSQIGASHLKKHGLTTQTYREQYPNAPLVKPVEWTDKRREAARQRRLGKKWDQSVKDKIGKAHRGKTIPPEAIAKQRESLLKTIKANGGGFNKGKTMSDEYRARCSEVAKARTPEQIQTKVEQMWAARRGQKESDEVREKKRNAQIKRMVETPEKIGIKFFDTIPEKEFEAELIRMGISYQKQYHTSKPHYLYDFKIGEDILIEIDGPYHYNPKMYKNNEDWIAAKARDEAKTLNAINQGFSIGRIQVGHHIPNNWLEILTNQGILIQKDPE